jgi:hypothetical protein
MMGDRMLSFNTSGNTFPIFHCISSTAMSSGSLVTMAWGVLRLWMEETASRYGGQLRIY